MKKFRARRYRRYQIEDYRRPRRYRRHRKRRTWTRQVVSTFTLLFVIAGLGLVAHSLILGEDSLVQRAVTTVTESEEIAASAPEDTTLWLTVPKMSRVEDLPVYDAAWDSEAALDASAAHLDSSGFPWDEEANVYISGHRVGFPGSKSFLVFYDLDALENGDEIFLTDSEGTKYTYEVFDEFVSDPFDWSPTEPVPGKNVLTLQTCTLPDYVDRLIVQAELTEVTPGADSPREEADSSQEEEVAPEADLPQEGVAPEVDLPQEGLAPQEEIAPEAIPQEEITPGAGLPPEEAVPQGEVAPEAA